MSDRTLTDPKVIDGKAFAAKLREKIARQVKQLQSQHGFTPGLAVVLVGEDPASKVYVRNKGEQTKESGMASFEHKLPAATSQAEHDNAITYDFPMFSMPVSAETVIAALSPSASDAA